MKKISQFLSIVIISVTLIACGGNDFPEKDNSLAPAGGNISGPVADTTNNINLPPMVGGESVTGLPVTTNAPASLTPKTNAKIAGLNPPHGEPGHRCDISVGAPLNSAPQNTSASPTVQPAQNVTVPNVPVPAPVSGGNAGKLNPAHGQPGHDCAVAVGAPLQ